jgi:methylenetetrahydrofolate reductase (NADPH)
MPCFSTSLTLRMFNQERSVSLSNPIREALTKGRFCYLAEIVATSRSPEPQILNEASQLAEIPGLVGGSVTNNAGGVPGHDAVHIAAAVQARGLAANVHVTCVRHDRHGLRKMLEVIHSLEIENVFAMTGDFPKSDPAAGVFDLDSVQLVHLMDEMRQAGNPYWIAVAVSPFKYAETDCMYQYLKLRKKVAAGADYAITQLGYDAAKFRELKRYVDENIGPFPMLGNVYILNNRAAGKMANGDIPGCWVSPQLQAIVKAESQEPDKGRIARLERAARMVSIVRGLGYAGVYLGGTHHAGDIRWIIQRAEILQPRWEESADELNFAPARAFYLYKSSAPVPANRGILPRVLDALVNLFPVNKDTGLRRLLTKIFIWMDRKPGLAQQLERIETAIKAPLFGCQSCGNCVLGSMEYVCPQTCPKQMRNGPCGGANNIGTCEVVEKPCIWISVYERARAANEVDRLRAFIPAPDRGLKGTSSWINYFLDRDVRPAACPTLPVVLSGAKPEDFANNERRDRIASAEKSQFVSLNTETGPKRR